jgi:hypothetical protein
VIAVTPAIHSTSILVQSKDGREWPRGFDSTTDLFVITAIDDASLDGNEV